MLLDLVLRAQINFCHIFRRMEIMPNQSSIRPLRQTGIYTLVVATSVGLTLGSLRLFPQLLPASTASRKSVEQVVPPSLQT